MLSILTCVAGRAPLFREHLKSVAEQDAAFVCEYCVAIWGDPTDHLKVIDEYKERFDAVHVVCVETGRWWPLPIAYNAALAVATRPRVLIVGSDVVIHSGTLSWAGRHHDEVTAWCLPVVNDDGQVFVGQRRKVALPYAMAVSRDILERAGGWDTTFCDGVCYDDNDLSARLLLSGAVFRWKDRLLAVHQKHPRYGRNERTPRAQRNRLIWRERLGDYDGSLWPIFWDDANPPDDVPPGDGVERQCSLVSALRYHGYPAKAIANE